ncbi:MAG: hypothetical protein H6607_02840 [Flavobacteriales bacterium]|nr:hypothetical protein [Flavobacteriales bacterium]
MKLKIYSFAFASFLILSVVFLGCSSGKNRFEKGEYDAATQQAIKRLRSNPDKKKAVKYLDLAYNHAVDYHLSEIDRLKASQDRFKFDDVVWHYQKLNELYNEIIKCPGCLEVIPNPKIFQNEFNESSLAASKAHFEYGLEQLNLNTKSGGREAYRHFTTAKNYTPKYSKIDEYISQALSLGTVRVLIENIPVHSRSLALTNEFFQNQISEYARGLNYTFVEFYRESEYNALNVEIDEVIVMKFDDFVVGQTYIKEKTETIEKDSVKIGTVKTSDGELPVIGKAKAKFTTYEKTLTSSGLLDFQIVDATSGATLRQQKFPGTFVWKTDWASYNGQEEALTAEQIKMSKRTEAYPPSPQDLFIEFTRPIYSQLVRSIANYYSGLN